MHKTKDSKSYDRARLHKALDKMLDARGSKKDGGPGKKDSVGRQVGVENVGNFTVTSHATNMHGVSNRHGVTLKSFPTKEEAVVWAENATKVGKKDSIGSAWNSVKSAATKVNSHIQKAADARITECWVEVNGVPKKHFTAAQEREARRFAIELKEQGASPTVVVEMVETAGPDKGKRFYSKTKV